MSCPLRSPIRTNKGREATETEGLVCLNNNANYAIGHYHCVQFKVDSPYKINVSTKFEYPAFTMLGSHL